MDSNRGMFIFLAADYVTGKYSESGSHDGLEFLLKNTDITRRFQEFCRLFMSTGSLSSDCLEALDADDNYEDGQSEKSTNSSDEDNRIDASPQSDTRTQGDHGTSQDFTDNNTQQMVMFPCDAQHQVIMDQTAGISDLTYSSVIQPGTSSGLCEDNDYSTNSRENVSLSDDTVNVVYENSQQVQSNCPVETTTVKRSDLIEREVHEFSLKKQFVCQTCLKVFTNISEYQDHTKTHHEEKQKNFICRSCKMVFTNRKEYIYHSCPKVLHQSSAMEQSDNNQPKDPIKVSGDTRQQNDSMENVCNANVDGNNITSGENGNTEIVKSIMGKLWSTHDNAVDKDELKTRFAGMYTVSNGGKWFECKFCKRTRRQEIAILRHIQVHESTNFKETFTCSICGRECKTDETYKYHLKTHLPKEDKEHQCDECEKAFIVRSKLYRHIELVHKNSKNFVCEVCGKKFKQSKQLKIHVRIHTGETPFECSQCPKTFRSNEHLLAHVRQWHERTQVVCDICGLVLASKERLLNHRWRHKQKSKSCDVCGKVFKGRASFLSHYTTHHLDEHNLKDFPHKVHRCSYCRKLFTNSHSYTVHLRTHTGEKPFTCDVCGKSFVEKGNLNAHTRTHTDEKQHQCSHCGKCFTSRWNLKKHEQSHDKKQVGQHITTS